MPKPIPPSPPTHHRYTFPEHGDPHKVSLQWPTKRIKPLVLPPTSFKDLVRWDLSRIIPRMDPSNSIIPIDSPDSKIVSRRNNKTVQTKLLSPSQATSSPSTLPPPSSPPPSFPPFSPPSSFTSSSEDSADLPWQNRIVHGDSLLGLHALVQAGYGNRIQMVYMDPPYGINFNAKVQMGASSNEGYIDTWTLGLGSYLEHLRERFLIIRSLMHPTGSIFVQIGQKNLHYVRCIMDEIFGAQNCVNVITYRTAISTNNVSNIADHLLWYAKDKSQVFQRQLYCDRPRSKVLKTFTYSQTDPSSGKVTNFKPQEIVKKIISHAPRSSRSSKSNRQPRKPRLFPLSWQSNQYLPPKGYEWRWDEEAMNRLLALDRVREINGKLYGKRFETDFPKMLLTNVWTDTSTSTFAAKKHYSVHTNPKVIQRCIAMATRPGDLIVDPTAGSGTTAVVAEKMGRRWIVFDTSALAIYSTLHWLSGSIFDQYQWDGETGEYKYRVIPKISLSQLAQDKVSPLEFQYDNPVVEKKKCRLTSRFTLSTLEREEIPPKWSAEWLRDIILTNGFLRISGESYSVSNLELTDLETLGCKNEDEVKVGRLDSDPWILFSARVDQLDGNPWLIVCLPPHKGLNQLKILQMVPKLYQLSQFSQIVLVTGQYHLILGTMQQLFKFAHIDEKRSTALNLGYFHQDLWADNLNFSRHPEAICLSAWIEKNPRDPRESASASSNFHIHSLGEIIPSDSIPDFGATWWIVPINISDGYLSAEDRSPLWFQIPGYSSYIKSSLKKALTQKLDDPSVWQRIWDSVDQKTSFHFCILDRRGVFHYGFFDFKSFK
ncbi:MAG: site-specific DNA-methyltransferase [Promethearchaeota archaeon]